MSKESHSLYRWDNFKKYFVKDNSYKNQNEFRFVFLNNNEKFTPLVPKDQDHIVLHIKPLVDWIPFDLNSNFLSSLRIE